MEVNRRSIIDHFSSCLLCGDPKACKFNLCNGCLRDLSPLNEAYSRCDRCGIPLKQTYSHFSPLCSEDLPYSCPECHKIKPLWNQLTAISGFDFPFSDILHKFKYQNSPAWAVPLAKLMEMEIKKQHNGKNLPEVVIPMPIHPIKLLKRGFNQSILLARPIARQLSIPLDTHSCQRIRQTLPQAGLGLAERKKNIQGCFRVKRNFAGMDVAIVEDAVTTGATLNELCRELKKSNAGEIHVWCIARTEL